MDDTASLKSPVSEAATSPTSTVSAGREHLSDGELILRLKLLDAQRQRGKIIQSRYEAKRKDLLRLCSNDDFQRLVLENGAKLVEGEIDQAGYEKRLRFLIDRLGDPGTLLEAHARFEEDLKATEVLDKKSRRLFDTPRLPKDQDKTYSPEQRSPEEEKFFASDAEQGWAFQTEAITRSRPAYSAPSAPSRSSGPPDPPAKDGLDPNALYGSPSAYLGYDLGVNPFDGDGWRVNVASAEPRGDVERPVRSVTNR